MAGTIVGNAIAKLKNLTRSRWQRTLIESELENACGEPTANGRDLVLRQFAEELWKEKREEIGTGLAKRNAEIKEEKAD